MKDINKKSVTAKAQLDNPANMRERDAIRNGIVMRPVTDEFIEATMGSLKTGGRALKYLLAERRREYG